MAMTPVPMGWSALKKAPGVHPGYAALDPDEWFQSRLARTCSGSSTEAADNGQHTSAGEYLGCREYVTSRSNDSVSRGQLHDQQRRERGAPHRVTPMKCIDRGDPSPPSASSTIGEEADRLHQGEVVRRAGRRQRHPIHRSRRADTDVEAG